jgi:hypothetical protein
VRRSLAIVGAVTVLSMGAWLALRESGPEGGVVAESAQKTPREATVASPPPGVQGSKSSIALAPRPAAKKTVFDEYLASRQHRALYDRLNGSPQGATPKGRLVLYQILRECAEVTGGLPWPLARRASRTTREQFLKNVATTDPRREQRIAAFDQFTADRCVGMSGVTVSSDDLLGLLRSSADGGEPAARALLVEHNLWGARSGLATTPTEAQVEELKEAAGSRDPEAIRVAGRVLANGWKDFSLRLGPEELPIETRPFVNAWLVLACEYGAPCGADTPRMQQACAFQGYCDAQSFPDYLAYYSSSPHDSTLLMQYRGIIRNAIETGDWSQLRILRAESPPGRGPMFVPGPR